MLLVVLASVDAVGGWFGWLVVGGGVCCLERCICISGVCMWVLMYMGGVDAIGVPLPMNLPPRNEGTITGSFGCACPPTLTHPVIHLTMHTQNT